MQIDQKTIKNGLLRVLPVALILTSTPMLILNATQDSNSMSNTSNTTQINNNTTISYIETLKNDINKNSDFKLIVYIFQVIFSFCCLIYNKLLNDNTLLEKNNLEKDCVICDLKDQITSLSTQNTSRIPIIDLPIFTNLNNIPTQPENNNTSNEPFEDIYVSDSHNDIVNTAYPTPLNI